jgi:hypothetical protein
VLEVTERPKQAQSATFQSVSSSTLRDWCIGILSSLKGSIDVPTVVGLLLELKSAREATSFINFGNSITRSGNFGKEFVKCKFNKDIPS